MGTNHEPVQAEEVQEHADLDKKRLVRGGGSWRDAAFHLATTIATPAAFAPLPYAVASLGWSAETNGVEGRLKEAGVVVVVMGTLVTCYCSILLASLWEFDGVHCYVRYRDLGRAIYGQWGYWAVIFFQQIASIGNNIAIQIVAGTSMKAIYLTYSHQNSVTLQDFIIIFGVVELLLSQLPDIHSLRKLNAVCTFCTVGFTGTAIGMSIYDGRHRDMPVDYGVHGSTPTKVFGIFSALGTVAFSFGDAMLPEIQATVREPAKKNMYKGISMAYTVIAVTYWLVAFVGYWAFGSSVNPYLVSSFTGPSWPITMANVFAVIQVAGCFQIYCRPTYEYVELLVMDNKKGPLTLHNCLRRLFVTTTYTVLVTLVAAAMPFFGDFVALCGAIGFTPLDFVLPIMAFLQVRKPKNPLIWAFNVGLIVLYTTVAILGSIGAIRFIVHDATAYKFFRNI